MDFVSIEKRKKIMSSIKGKDTKPEILIRKILTTNNIRYRLHLKNLPGKPDLCFLKIKVAIFINGCFWHNHTCKDGHIPSTNGEFWSKKIYGNKERDNRNIKLLESYGWKVIVLWECEIRADINSQLEKIKSVLSYRSQR